MKVERFNPHIVLLDLMMDDLDGFEVCRKLRNDPAHATTIVVALPARPRRRSRPTNRLCSIASS